MRIFLARCERERKRGVMNKTKTILGDIYDTWRDQDVERIASYLPHDFSHVIHVPPELRPLGGTCLGKEASLERLALIFSQFDCLFLDAKELMVDGDRAAVEIQMHCRHRETQRGGEGDESQFLDVRERLAHDSHRILRPRPVPGPHKRGCGRDALSFRIA